MTRRILVAVAWPYASGPLHLGHLGGAYLPPDIFARYHRLIGNEVLMVSGSDANGTPITVKAEELGITPEEVVNTYHPEILGYWDDLGISFDLFTTTMTENHHRVTQDFFLRLLEAGYLVKGTSEQFYDPEAGRFLPDRYVEGTCPHCGYPDARGDQCDNCGRTLDPTDLIDPRSRLSGATPVRRETEHYFLDLPAFKDRLTEWLESKTGWRKHVRNWALGMVADMPRSWASVVLATVQPLLTPPTTLASGQRASLKNTSLKSAVPSGWVIGRTSILGWRIGTSRYEMPACFGAPGSVRASRKM